MDSRARLTFGKTGASARQSSERQPFAASARIADSPQWEQPAMDIQATATALRRARKRLTHATRQAARDDLSERAHRRHVRRVSNAARFYREAADWFAELAAVEDDETELA